MICLTDCACNIRNDCMRDTAHLNSAMCRDRTEPKMLSKNKRIVNIKLIKKIKEIGYCELCGSSFNLETHHIKSKGSGGDDVPENLVCLCAVCHRTVHDGNILRETLHAIVEGRENNG